MQDEKEKQPAIIMHFISIKEQLQKIQDSNDIQILSIFDKEEIRGLSAVRNIASHDYEGLNLEIIESIIRVNLPIIKDKIDNFFACNP